MSLRLHPPAMEHREYLARNGIGAIINEMIMHLLKEKPPCAIGFMHAWLAENAEAPGPVTRVPDVVFKTRVRDPAVPGPNPFRWQDRTTQVMWGAPRRDAVGCLPPCNAAA